MWTVTGQIARTENNDSPMLERDGALHVSAKQNPACPVGLLCQAENYQHPFYESSFAKQMLLNAKWVIKPT